MLTFATGTPLAVYLTSGSCPTFSTKITLLTLFAMSHTQFFRFMSTRWCCRTPCSDSRNRFSPAASRRSHTRGISQLDDLPKCFDHSAFLTLRLAWTQGLKQGSLFEFQEAQFKPPEEVIRLMMGLT